MNISISNYSNCSILPLGTVGFEQLEKFLIFSNYA